MENFEHGSLGIALSREGDKTLMLWSGRSDEPAPGLSLTPYLEGTIGDLEGTQLIIDFKKVEYMNSATVPPLFVFLRELNSREITTRLKYDADSKWQVATFKALESFASLTRHISVVRE
jgi:hypothetical protein